MAEQVDAKGEKKTPLGALVGWLGLALGSIGFIWFISQQLGAGWEGRENEALDVIKTMKLPGMARSLTDSTIDLGNAARQAGQPFVGQFSWSASQVEGPLYAVKLTWMEGSEHRRAEWKVDLENKNFYPTGPTTAEFMKRTGATSIPTAPPAS